MTARCSFCAAGKAPVEPPHQRRHLPVGLGEHPWRGALEEREVLDVRLDRGDELDRARARADHGDAPPAQVVVVVPLRRVEDRALELVDARDLGDRRLVQRAGAPDDHTGADGGAVGEPERPAPARPLRGGDLGAVPDAGAQPVAVGDVLEVGADLGLRGELAAPVRVGREGERVEVRLHVAGAAGVGVVAPGAAERRRPSRAPRSRCARPGRAAQPRRARRTRCPRWRRPRSAQASARSCVSSRSGYRR